jgi:predicted dehydrogenase
MLAIASRDAGKAKAVAQEFGVPRHFGSYDALIADPEIEVLRIRVPNHLHVEWSVKALAAGQACTVRKAALPHRCGCRLAAAGA